MSRKIGWLGAGLTVATIATAASFLLGASPAQAVVYCKTVGVPKGCVVRPTLWRWLPWSLRRPRRRRLRPPASVRPAWAYAPARR